MFVTDFRAAHASPLLKTRVDLGRVVTAETNATPVVSQRLKRLERTVSETAPDGQHAAFHPQDAGGCRAILPSLDKLRGVQERLLERWPDAKIRNDYIESPTEMGYRAVHIVARRDGRQIEVQLRTTLQQAWADAVEAIDGRRGTTLKDETGPAPWLRFFAASARLLFEDDCG